MSSIEELAKWKSSPRDELNCPFQYEVTSSCDIALLVDYFILDESERLQLR